MQMDTNEQLIRRLFNVFGRRDLDKAVAMFAEDAVFRVPGRSAISGSYRGRAGVLDYWHRQIELSGGSFRTQVVSVDPADDHVVVSVVITAERDGRPISWRRIVDYRVAGNEIAEAAVTEADQAAADSVFRTAADSSRPSDQLSG